MLLRVAGIVNDSIVDGPGLRMTVFVQGCPHHCEGCHNPDTHPLDGGELIEVSEIARRAFDNPLLDGLTFSGGEPFLQCEALCELADLAIAKGFNIIAYTGYTWEELIGRKDAFELIKRCKYVIDGPFILEQKSLMLNFRGSKNQRIIDVKKSLEEGKVFCVEL
jgi:anaerobic ribonucleoside-triphosphate reductase activating protein